MTPSTRSSLTTGRVVFAVVLGLVAVAFLVVGIMFSVEPAGSLPSWLGHETVKVGNQVLPSPSYHPYRAVGSLIAGLVFAVGAVFTLKYKGTGITPAADPAQPTHAPHA